MAHATAFYRTLHRLGILVPGRADAAGADSGGQRTPAELIDRFDLACRPVRDLLVDYLCERAPALDYSSLRSLAADLGNVFWKDLERHHPGINSLHLPPRSPPRGSSGCAPGRRPSPPPPATRRPSPWNVSATASA